MEAIILAGGFGTRLSKVIKDLPKPMALINGTPFLEIILNHLNSSGFNTIILSVGYMSQYLIDHFGDSYKDLKILYSIEDYPLGTGGAIKQSLELCTDDHIYILNGDTFLNIKFKEVEKKWFKYSLPIMISRYVDDVTRYGSLSFKNKILKTFSEKKKSGPGFINAGCYVLPKDIMQQFVLEETFSFENNCIEKIMKNKKFLIYNHEEFFIDIGTPEDFDLAQEKLMPYLKATS